MIRILRPVLMEASSLAFSSNWSQNKSSKMVRGGLLLVKKVALMSVE